MLEQTVGVQSSGPTDAEAFRRDKAEQIISDQLRDCIEDENFGPLADKTLSMHWGLAYMYQINGKWAVAEAQALGIINMVELEQPDRLFLIHICKASLATMYSHQAQYTVLEEAQGLELQSYELWREVFSALEAMFDVGNHIVGAFRKLRARGYVAGVHWQEYAKEWPNI